jgi:hypothetical protein
LQNRDGRHVTRARRDEQTGYDLDADPGETRNVAPAHAAIVDRLDKVLAEARRPR